MAYLILLISNFIKVADVYDQPIRSFRKNTSFHININNIFCDYRNNSNSKKILKGKKYNKNTCNNSKK